LINISLLGIDILIKNNPIKTIKQKRLIYINYVFIIILYNSFIMPRDRHEIIYNLFITIMLAAAVLLSVNYLIKYEKYNLYLKS